MRTKQRRVALTHMTCAICKLGAGKESRTLNLLDGSQLLCQLSYTRVLLTASAANASRPWRLAPAQVDPASPVEHAEGHSGAEERQELQWLQELLRTRQRGTQVASS